MWSGDNATGSLLQYAPGLQTIEANSGTYSQTFSVPSATRSYRYTIFGYFLAGSVGLRIEGCPDAVCSSSVTLFLGTVNYAGSYVGTHTTVSVIPSIATPCPYGTRLQSTAQAVYFIVPGLIDAWLLAIGQPLAAVFFTALYYSQINTELLCQSGPPAVPALTADTTIPSRDTLEQLLRVVAWPNVCECTPGFPSPDPYPPPTIVLPPSLIQFPITNVTVAGDPAALTEIVNQLHRVQYTQAQIQDLVFSMQRFKAPFGYRLGRSFPGVSGEGVLGVQRLAGLHFDVTTEPPGKVHLPGNPDYVKDLGWISISTASGMLKELRVSQLHRDWFT
jgi:hypothetical protein